MTVRILSDLHYGDRSSRLLRLAQLRPLCDEAPALVLNGDTLDTRAGPRPAATAALRAEVADFFGGRRATLLTGNHDPDISPRHSLELAGGEVFVVHGDVVFDSIVPWGRDAGLIGRRIGRALAALPGGAESTLEERLAVFRRVAAEVRQRHQSETHGLKYLLGYAVDTLWPPWRAPNIWRAWRSMPALCAELARRHRPRARFVVVGHTHRPGVWRRPDGRVVINTGSFCRPLGGLAVDLSPQGLTVRRVERRGGEFRTGEKVAQFALGGASAGP